MLFNLFAASKQLGLVAALMAAGSTHAMFRFDCFNNLVVDRVDPITSLGTAGGHLHAISGGNGFSMNADGDAMLNSSCTSCPIGADLSAYWVPQLYVKYKNGSGFGLVESHQIVYYEPRPKKGEKVIAFPPGLKMLAGDPNLRTKGDSIEEKAITWVCIDYANSHPEQQGIPNFKCPQGLRGQVNFPMCWNGKDLDSPDHKSHVAYATGLDGGDCPDGFQKMVKIFYEAFYSVDKYDSEWVDGKHPFVLANGDPTGFGFHGDFLNGWDVKVLQDAVDQCTDKNYFNSGECPPLKASFNDKPPAQRCTLKPEVVEPITNIAKLPGNNPVTYVAPVSTPSPAATTVDGDDDDGDADSASDENDTTDDEVEEGTSAPSSTPSATEETGAEATDAPTPSSHTTPAPKVSSVSPTTATPSAGGSSSKSPAPAASSKTTGCKVKSSKPKQSAASSYKKIVDAAVAKDPPAPPRCKNANHHSRPQQKNGDDDDDDWCCSACESDGADPHCTHTVLLADGSEEIEAITLADVLVRGGVKVTLASVGRKPENIVTLSRGVKVQADLAIEACVDLRFDLIVAPGGQPGSNHLRDSEVLIELLRQQKHEGKLYGAICAAPAVVLHTHGLLGSPATGYTGFEKQVTDVEYSKERVVVAGNCVTSQGPGTAMEMGVKLVELLSGKEKAEQVAKALLLV